MFRAYFTNREGVLLDHQNVLASLAKK